MNNLVIGNTSQLSYYFPDDYEKISSRDINFTEIKKKNIKEYIFYLLSKEHLLMNL